MKLYELEPELEDISNEKMLHIHVVAALVSALLLFATAFITIS